MAKLPKVWVLRSKELESILGSRMAVKRKAEAGELQSLGSGIYASASLDPMQAAVIAVTKYFPKAVISGRTALFLHQLSDHAVDRVDVDISTETSIRNQILNVHRVAARRKKGISELKIKGFSVRVYDLERTLCEAYRLDPAGPDFFKALKRYLSRQNPDSEKIALYDKAAGTKVLVHVMQELADG